ncbi:zinc-dependent metalloprotease [Aureibacter tunicatorum]|uniref:Por secretion system C-terminal sorting domain-containing protein n=1 Tax=Aureibacter tunicatorum TaxID=866807 RepID=A0AAE3XNU1_9BACT|nr:zinc-dependent metalloprotease [Aureibacter tunicatorum]MDR6241341.1 hypothetical protein [Aureibacter tunicatorum]BDD03600.1 hypothetical protein AUTU_10830 [Aureibacter tunicatorum]
MNKKLLLWGLAILIPLIGAFAHEHPSHTHHDEELHKKNMQENSEYADSYNRLQEFINSYIQKQRASRSADVETNYIIPLIFHISDGVRGFNLSSRDVVTRQQIESAVEILNEDYNALNDDYNDVDPRFAHLRANMGIEFRLAIFDPEGNRLDEAGIVRYPGVEYDGRNEGKDGGRDNNWRGSLLKDNTDYWPGYVNIWLTDIPDLDTGSDDDLYGSGWAFLPNQAYADEGIDGIVFNPRFLGWGGFADDRDFNLHMKRVLTHELGHFLNLAHPFQGGCDGPNDFVDDTPPTTSHGPEGCNDSFEPCGVPVNHENFMDYSACTKMFTFGQKERLIASLNSPEAERNQLWTPENLKRTLGIDSYALSFDKLRFKENLSNDGLVDSEIEITIKGTSDPSAMNFTKPVGQELVSGTDYRVSNVPDGLTPVVTVASATSVKITFTGKANAHTASESVTNFELEFLAPAFNLDVSMIQNPGSDVISIVFRDDYDVIYKKFSPAVSNNSGSADDDDDRGNVGFTIDLSVPNTYFYTYADGDYLELGMSDEGGRQVLATMEPGSTEYTYVEMLDEGVEVGSNPAGNSQWLTSNINASNYYYHSVKKTDGVNFTSWVGQSKYAGISFEHEGERFYGWIQIAVNAAGDEITVIDAAYYNKPDGPIVTGFKGSNKIVPGSLVFNENEENNGSVGSTTFEIISDNVQFKASTGQLTLGTDYTVENIPSGLTAELEIASSNEVTLNLIGNADKHESYHNVDNITLTFNNSAFSNNDASAFKDVDFDLSINFEDKDQILIEDGIEYVPLNVYNDDGWEWFRITDNQASNPNDESQWGFGTFWNTGKDPGAWDLEMYQVGRVVVIGNTTNIDKLESGDVVGPNSNLLQSEAYPDYPSFWNDNYTVFENTEGFIGLELEFTNGQKHYAWLQIAVGNNANDVTVIDAAYRLAPNLPITIPQLAPVISPASSEFQLRLQNGNAMSVDNVINIKNGEFNSAINGDLIEGTHYTVDGLPSGFTLEISKSTATSLMGRIVVSDPSSLSVGDAFENITIEFTDAAFEGVDADKVINVDLNNYSIAVKGPYKIIYGDEIVDGNHDVATKTIDKGDNTFRKWFFTLDMDFSPSGAKGHGIWYNGSSFEVESYQGFVVSVDGDRNVTLINENEVIDENSNWVQGGDSNNLHHLYNDDYTVWAGQTGYAGFRFTIAGKDHYGWAQFAVAADGSTVEIIDYAYNEEPEAQIKAGQKEKEIEAQDQTITFNLQSTAKVGDANIALTATATSGLDVAYSSSDVSVVRIENGELLIVGPGTADVTASQDGNDEFNPAEDVIKSITIENSVPLGNNDLTANIKIHPNPNQGVFHVNGIGITIQSIIVYNVIGKQIATITEGSKVDISDQVSGVYLVHINTSEGKVVKRVLVK